MSELNEKRKNPFLDNKYNQNRSCDQDNCMFQCNDIDGGIVGDIRDNMTASYSEISFHTNYNAHSKEEGYFDNNHQIANVTSSLGENKDSSAEQERDKNCPQRPASLVCDKSFLFNLEGTVSKDGDMTHFVAENLEYKIKLSSPVTKKDSSQPGSSRNSTPSASGLIPRQFLLPQPTTQIDSNVLYDIEIEAQYLAASVDNLTENLGNLLHSISSITADNVEIHKNAVNKLTDSMDANIKSMYTIMAKTEEMSKSMKPTEQLANRLREIKRLVDMLESTL